MWCTRSCTELYCEAVRDSILRPGHYTIAAQHGPVTVAAVLASLDPVVTALAARGFLRERLRAVQAAGAGLALVGTVLLATG